MRCALLNDRVALEVRIGFRELFQLGLVVYIWFGHLKGTCRIRGVGIDFDNAVNFFQSTSDRGGASASRHVGYFERHDCARHGTRRRRSWTRLLARRPLRPDDRADRDQDNSNQDQSIHNSTLTKK
jgi:hypothetical protein